MKRAHGETTHPVEPDTEPDLSRRFVSPRQLALRWDCSRTAAQRIATRARLTKYFLGEGRNGMVRYRLDEIEAYEKARRATTVTALQ